jgi:hypothetical protein
MAEGANPSPQCVQDIGPSPSDSGCAEAISPALRRGRAQKQWVVSPKSRNPTPKGEFAAVLLEKEL